MVETLARQDQHCDRLMTRPGIGPTISSAMVAAIGTGDVFSKGRDLGAWLGLVPKQISTGDRTILGSISSRSISGVRTSPMACPANQLRQPIVVQKTPRAIQSATLVHPAAKPA